jgi:dipeptidyl aminopeptidase/acylaminoacyl peptidase
MVGAVPSFQVLMLAQNRPSNLPGAISADPTRDAANPTRNEAVWIPSDGVLMNGVMYAAAGAENHPTVLKLHGTPGNDQFDSRKLADSYVPDGQERAAAIRDQTGEMAARPLP